MPCFAGFLGSLTGVEGVLHFDDASHEKRRYLPVILAGVVRITVAAHVHVAPSTLVGAFQLGGLLQDMAAFAKAALDFMLEHVATMCCTVLLQTNKECISKSNNLIIYP